MTKTKALWDLIPICDSGRHSRVKGNQGKLSEIIPKTYFPVVPVGPKETGSVKDDSARRTAQNGVNFLRLHRDLLLQTGIVTSLSCLTILLCTVGNMFPHLVSMFASLPIDRILRPYHFLCLQNHVILRTCHHHRFCNDTDRRHRSCQSVPLQPCPPQRAATHDMVVCRVAMTQLTEVSVSAAPCTVLFLPDCRESLSTGHCKYQIFLDLDISAFDGILQNADECGLNLSQKSRQVRCHAHGLACCWFHNSQMFVAPCEYVHK